LKVTAIRSAILLKRYHRD